MAFPVGLTGQKITGQLFESLTGASRQGALLANPIRVGTAIIAPSSFTTDTQIPPTRLDLSCPQPSEVTQVRGSMQYAVASL